MTDNNSTPIVDRITNYFEDVRLTIRNRAISNLKLYLIIVIPIIILLIYFVYKYNFSNRTTQIINNMNYKSQLSLVPLPQCYELDPSLQHKLCDYYISSSFMTPCVGNQQYDYVSADMIIEIIQSGARYIQIPICEADATSQPLPIIATTQYGQKIITSLNTLELLPILKIIRNNSFKINQKSINYPLIIHLILNTANPFTLGIVSDNIQETLSDIIVPVNNYQTFPIFLEKLCNLLGKVIIFSTPGYEGTKLQQYIVPTKNMFQNYYYDNISSINIPADTSYTNSYNNKLSIKQQTKSNTVFKQKYPSLDYIIQHSNTIGDTILNDTDILNNLTNFNKIGMTIVKPNQPTDVISTNYDPTEAIYNGCQFIAMNFQVNDDNIKNYLKIFKDGSFKLKPASMRFSETEVPTRDVLSMYKAIIPKDNNILNDIYYKYNYLLIALEPFSSPNTFLTQNENNLNFTVGSNVIKDKFGNKTFKIGLNQAFVITKSTVGTGGEDIPVFLESAYNRGNFISLNGNYFDMAPLSNKKEILNTQSFYFEKSKSNDDTSEKQMVSVKTIDPSNSMYIACENKKIKAYGDIPQVQAQNNMSFYLHIVPFKIQVKIITLYDGILKTMGGGIVGVLENNTSDGTTYILEPATKGNKNFNYLRDQFYMKNAKTNTYLGTDLETNFLYDKLATASSNSIFNFNLDKGFYNIINSKGQQLIIFQNNILKFVDENEIISNENLFKINMSYIL